MAETVPAEQPDPNVMDLADLAEMIDNPSTEEAPPAEEPEAEQEPVTEPDEEEATEEEVAEETTDDTEEEEVTEPEEPGPTIEGLQSDLEHEVAQRRHFESVAGRNAGEVGYLRNQYQALKDEIAGLQQQRGRDDDIEPEPAPRREYHPPTQGLGSVQDTRIAQSAMSLGAQSFMIDNPGAMVANEATGQQEFDPEIGRVLESTGANASHLLESQDANYVMQQTKMFLEAAYRKVQADRIVKQRAERGPVSVDQAEKLKRKKRVSAAASTSGSTAASKPKPIDPATMPIDDLAKLIDRLNE